MNNQTTRLNHEDLDCYRAAIEFLALATKLAAEYPRGYSAYGDQLKRASLSIPLNIAEGYGKRSPRDRSRFYDIARGSAHECAALLDAAVILNLVAKRSYSDGKRLLWRIVSMLVKLSG